MSDREMVSKESFSQPLVAQAVEGRLTVQRPDGESGITVAVTPLPDDAEGSAATLQVYGEQADGSPLWLGVAVAETVTETEVKEGWIRPIAWEQLQSLKIHSHLVFVYELDHGTGNAPEMFPPLSLDIQELYEDRTTFSAEDGTDNWNGWMRGEAAVDLRDFVVEPDGVGHSLFSKTYTEHSNGTVLKKSFADLEPGRTYSFGIRVRREIYWHEAPILSLNCTMQTIVPETRISGAQVLEGPFTARAAEMELQIVSHVATGIGNDYSISEIWVRSL